MLLPPDSPTSSSGKLDGRIVGFKGFVAAEESVAVIITFEDDVVCEEVTVRAAPAILEQNLVCPSNVQIFDLRHSNADKISHSNTPTAFDAVTLIVVESVRTAPVVASSPLSVLPVVDSTVGLVRLEDAELSVVDVVKAVVVSSATVVGTAAGVVVVVAIAPAVLA